MGSVQRLFIIVGICWLMLLGSLMYTRQHDDDWIVVATEHQQQTALYRMHPDGSDLSPTVKLPGPSLWNLKVSPDGRWIAYIQRDPLTPDPQVFVLDWLGRQRYHVAQGSAFEWSPDSRYLVVVRSGIHNELIVVRYNGQEPRLVAGYPGDATNPYWSPDGQWIYFTYTDRAGDSSDIYRVRPDGTSSQNMTLTPLKSEYMPFVTPDSRYLYYLQYLFSGSESYLFSVDLAENHTRMVDKLPPLSFGEVSWAQEQMRMSAQFRERLFVYSPAHPLKLLTPNKDQVWPVDWSPDGESLIFSIWENGYSLAQWDGRQVGILLQKNDHHYYLADWHSAYTQNYHPASLAIVALITLAIGFVIMRFRRE